MLNTILKTAGLRYIKTGTTKATGVRGGKKTRLYALDTVTLKEMQDWAARRREIGGWQSIHERHDWDYASDPADLE